MACTNCSTKSNDSGTPKGCNNNGTCGTDSCNKLSVFDWLSNMDFPSGHVPFDVVEVRFKNGRKDFYKNTDNLSLAIGDVVATETSPGHDIGVVTLTGELVKVQMNKKKVDQKSALLRIYRKATQRDIDIWTESKSKEETTKVRAREIAIRLNLEMKISDVEYQGDNSKATFYYTANDRVDFRQLIKEFARSFNIRIEMKQVGFRQEAARLGGIGSCGRELCCSTWLTDFRSVNTSAARYQQLSLNPQKLAGQCGKLKCCLNYELDTYLDAIKDLPDIETKIRTQKGEAVCQKIDIFKGIMWFAYIDNFANWHMLQATDVKEFVELNKKGEKISSIEDYAIDPIVSTSNEEEDVKGKIFQTALSEDSLSRFDQPRRKKKPVRKRKPGQEVVEKVNEPKQTGNKSEAGENPNQNKRQGQNQNRKRNNSGNKPKGTSQGGENNDQRNQRNNSQNSKPRNAKPSDKKE